MSSTYSRTLDIVCGRVIAGCTARLSSVQSRSDSEVGKKGSPRRGSRGGSRVDDDEAVTLAKESVEAGFPDTKDKLTVVGKPLVRTTSEKYVKEKKSKYY